MYLPWALLSLPSPPSPTLFEVGPLVLSYHGLFIALGIIAGTWITQQLLVARGYDGALAVEALFIVVPAGIVGARLYHVVIEYDRYAARPASILSIWDGGLAIYGAMAGGFVGLLIFCYLRGVRPLAFADAVVPGLALGQAIGRWGNYFNQELFGRPSDLPWAIRIVPQNRPVEYADAISFHPTFAYEALWDFVLFLTLLWVARRFRRGHKEGDILLLYVCLYSVGRFLVETLRVDRAFMIGETIPGNLLVSGVLAVGAGLGLYLGYRGLHRGKAR